MGDLNSKRGRIQGSSSIGSGEVEIVAFVPTSEVLRYAIDLRSITGGRGHVHDEPLALRPGAVPPRRQGRRGQGLGTRGFLPREGGGAHDRLGHRRGLALVVVLVGIVRVVVVVLLHPTPGAAAVMSTSPPGP